MSGVPSSATIWFAIWVFEGPAGCAARGSSCSPSISPRGPPPDRTIQGPRANSGTSVYQDGFGGRVAYCLRTASYQPSRLNWEKG
jgi:hypothetical protein